MADRAPADLAREARVFTAALVGAEASEYVVREYARGHNSLPLAPVQGFDAVLMRVALGGPHLTRLADAYARLLARRAILRRKLALMLAILESTEPTASAFTPLPSPAAMVLLRLFGLGAMSVAKTALAVAVIGPLHIASRLAAGRV